MNIEDLINDEVLIKQLVEDYINENKLKIMREENLPEVDNVIFDINKLLCDIDTKLQELCFTLELVSGQNNVSNRVTLDGTIEKDFWRQSPYLKLVDLMEK